MELASGSDRAFGGLRSGAVIPSIGVSFDNNTGNTITTLDIKYDGEQWRLGTAGRADKLLFEYSTTATSLTSLLGWTGVSALDFPSPISTGAVGMLNGNLAANGEAGISSSITGLSIPNGAKFWIRFTDIDVSGADDAMAIDNFNLTPTAPTPVAPLPSVPLAALALFSLVGLRKFAVRTA